MGRQVGQAFIDGEKIEQVIINILLNAIEVLPSRGTILVATKRGQTEQSTIRVEVSDNGPGMSRDDLPYIFDPFFSSEKKGTGLGLSNVKKIVEAHGGSVTAVLRRKGMRLGFHPAPSTKTCIRKEFS